MIDLDLDLCKNSPRANPTTQTWLKLGIYRLFPSSLDASSLTDGTLICSNDLLITQSDGSVLPERLLFFVIRSYDKLK